MPFSKANVADAEFGLDTFGDVTKDSSGNLVTHAQAVRSVIEQGVLADSVGVDIFGIGEHHDIDYAVSNPAVVLAAIATRTSRIRLTSSVTVLSADDPVRIFEKYSSIHAISKGRAEVIVGKGSFADTFPLFGLDPNDYDDIYAEKLELWAQLIGGSPVTWSGSVRPALDHRTLFPLLESPLRTWTAVSGNPEAVMRAARYSMPLMLATLSGDPLRFKSFVDLYHQANARFGHGHLPMGVHAAGFVAATDEEAHTIFKDEWISASNRHANSLIGKQAQRQVTEEDYLHEVEKGSLFVGSPETVAKRIARLVEHLGLNRFQLKYSEGHISHENLMTCIELYGKEVIPRVREILREIPTG